MKSLKTLLALPLLVMAGSCTSEMFWEMSGLENFYIRSAVPDTVSCVFCGGAGTDSKSCFYRKNDEVNSLCVTIYRNGKLYDAVATQGNSATLKLALGGDYHVYALANAGQVNVPLSETEMLDYRLSIGSIEDLNTLGIPMSYQGTVSVSENVSMSVDMKMTRLAGRYSLKLAPQLVETSFDITSVRVRQAAMDVTPFKSNSTPAITSDGDFASKSDVDALNNGGIVDFYILENCGGVLLTGNADPWEKNPDNIGPNASECTFLEIGTDWSTPGATADVKLRMYLGQDNCTDFNVVRNSSVNLTVCLEDELSYRTSWKAFTSGLQDNRVLSFDSNSLSVWKACDWQEVSSLNIVPKNVSFSANVSGADLQTKIKDGKLYIRTTKTGAGEAVGELTVVSWDGHHSATVPVVVRNPGFKFADGAFVTEAGNVSFSAADGIYYDWVGDLSLCDLDGNTLDASKFNTSVLLDNCSAAFSSPSLAGYEVKTLASPTGGSFARVYLYGLGAIPSGTKLEFGIASDYGSALTNVKCYKTFPDLPSGTDCFNYSVAPGNLRSYETSLGIYPSDHPWPSETHTQWKAYHYVGGKKMTDDYVALMSVKNGKMLFEQMSPSTFPSCGLISLEAKTTNPHSGVLLSNEYIFDLALFVSVGVKLDLVDKKLLLRYAPFCEYATTDYDNTWVTHMPSGMKIVDPDGGINAFPVTAGEYAYNLGLPPFISGISTPSASFFSSNARKFNFQFVDTVTGDYVNSFMVNMLNPIKVKGYITAMDGSKGYYKFVRQCDLNNMPSPRPDYNGYSNLVIDAAYDLF